MRGSGISPFLFGIEDAKYAHGARIPKVKVEILSAFRVGIDVNK